MRKPDGYDKPQQVPASEAAGFYAGRGVRNLVGGTFRLAHRYPLIVLLLVLAYWVLSLGQLGWIITGVIVVGLVVASRFEPRVGRAALAVWGWQRDRHHAHYDRLSGVELALELGLVDRDGAPYQVNAVRHPESRHLLGLDIVAPLSDQDIQGRLGVWQAQLQLAPGYVLMLRPGGHRGHHLVEVVAPPEPLPEQVSIPELGDFNTGLVLGLMDGGQLWRWDPHDQPHVLLTGSTGSGKTVTDKRFVTCWLAAGGEVALLDYGKGTAFPEYEGKRHVRRAVDKADCEALLSDVRNEVDRRYLAWQTDRAMEFRPLLAVLEEPFVMMESMSGRDEDAKEDQRLSGALRDHMTRIALLGRECSIHMVLAPQRGDAMVMGGAVRDQLALRICLLANAKDATVSMALEMSRDALVSGMEPPVRVRDLASPKGRALIEDPSGLHLVQISL